MRYVSTSVVPALYAHTQHVRLLCVRILEVHFDVLEGVLLDVSDSKIGMFFYATGLGDGFSGKEFDQGGFAGAVRADDGDTGGKGEHAADAEEGGFGGSGIAVGAVGHADDRFGVGLDACEDAGIGKFELDVRC